MTGRADGHQLPGAFGAQVGIRQVVAVLALLLIGWAIYIVWVIVGAAMARTVWVIVLHDD